MPAPLGIKMHGSGPVRVLVLHDWFCDHSSWNAALAHLTEAQFTYAFLDLRGYGASKDIEGAYTLEEAAADTIAAADRLGWTRFARGSTDVGRRRVFSASYKRGAAPDVFAWFGFGIRRDDPWFRSKCDALFAGPLSCERSTISY